MSVDCFLDAYADGVAAVIIAHGREIIQILLSRVMRTVFQWMKNHELQLAGEKTEIVVIIRR